MIDFETGNSRFGEVMAQALHMKRLSQTDLALKANISQSTVSKLVSGKRSLTMDVAQRISAALGGTADDWLQAQTDIVAGSAKSAEEYASRIMGRAFPASLSGEDLGTRVTQLRKADILRIFDGSHDGEVTRRSRREPCLIDPFLPERVGMTTYDTRAGCYGTPPQDNHWWTGEPVDGPLVIPPQGFRYIGTLEYIEMPSWLEGELHPASNIAHKPLLVLHGPVIDPLFSGRLFVTVFNLTNEPLEISQTEPFLSLRFWLAEDQAARD